MSDGLVTKKELEELKERGYVNLDKDEKKRFALLRHKEREERKIQRDLKQAPQRKREQERIKKMEGYLGAIVKVVLVLIVLYLLAYWFASNPDEPTQEECLRYARNAQEREYCMNR